MEIDVNTAMPDTVTCSRLVAVEIGACGLCRGLAGEVPSVGHHRGFLYFDTWHVDDAHMCLFLPPLPRKVSELSKIRHCLN